MPLLFGVYPGGAFVAVVSPHACVCTRATSGPPQSRRAFFISPSIHLMRANTILDTIGNTPMAWMWWDPNTNADRKPGGLAAIKAVQDFYKQQWPRNYPPFGG